MSGTTGIEGVVKTEPFEKATLKLHCVLCGDTMFVVGVGKYICIGCDVRQEIMIRFGDKTGFEQFADEILPEEVHIIHRFVGIDVNILHKVLEGLGK